jgi:hypothetical protein
MLISQTHFTEKLPQITQLYSLPHQSSSWNCSRRNCNNHKKNSIQHHTFIGYCFDFLQATTVSVEDSVGSLIISAVYLLPTHIVKQEQLETFYITLAQRFIAGGNYNAKHTAWGSRLITPRGREVHKTMEHLHLRHLSTGEPTYWPSDRNKLPGLLDFCVTKGMPPNSAAATSCFDLSSDHSPVIVILTSHALPPETPPRLSNRRTNRDFL